MAAPPYPQAGPNHPQGARRPRAWLARRMAAVLSVAVMLGLGGLMYWNDQPGTANAAQATTSPTTNQSTSSVDRSEHESDDDEHEWDDDDEGEDHDEGSSIVDDIASLIPGLSESSSSSNSTSNSGTSQQQTVPAPHTNTRGS